MISFRKKSCSEMACILNYVEQVTQGKSCACPCAENPIHIKVLEQMKRLVANEQKLSISAKRLLDIISAFSNFDVEMSYISSELAEFSEELAGVSESNLAIIQETTASMGQVAETIERTSQTLDELSKDSTELAKQNNQGQILLHEMLQLKDEVQNDSTTMKENIGQLVDLTKEVDRIVNSVQGIASQTNLLALNAAIEAARAGEMGKGFAVVAEEVRTLADDTKINLEGMKKFVSDIRKAASESQESLERSLNSTNSMGEKIDLVSKTVGNNINMLKGVISDIHEIDDSMQDVKGMAQEISNAMEATSRDAQRLTEMTQVIKVEAEKSTKLVNNVSDIDNQISAVVEDLFSGLHEGKRAITNEELLQVIEKARKAHLVWTEKLKNMVNTMKAEPLQTNDKKCAFGHFYHAIQIQHPKVKDLWNQIDSLHHQVHNNGIATIKAIKEERQEEANSLYQQEEADSKALIALLDKIKDVIKQMTNNQEYVFNR